MFSSPVTEQTEELLDEILKTIRQECQMPDSVLCETDRSAFVKEEARLRKLLGETPSGSQSTSWSLQSLLGLPSPRARKCLEDAKALRQRVKNEIGEKLRSRLSGESITPSSNREPGSAVDRTNAWDAKAGVTPPSADGNSESTNSSADITSPANPNWSLPELSGVNDNPTTDHNHRFSEAINDRVSGDRSSSSSGRRRRTPPPPPSPRRIVQSNDSESDDSSSGHYGRSPRADTHHTANTHLRWGSGRNESLKIIGSHVKGMTLINDSTNCTGAVIHEHTVMLPQRSSRPASRV